MATLAELRAALRVMLGDNGAEGYLWNDGALDLHLNDAVRDYSRSFPREREATLSTVAGQPSYDLPADCLVVVRAEYLEGAVRYPLTDGGDSWGSGYQQFGGRIILSPTPADSGHQIVLGYLAPHAALEAGDDPSTVAAADGDLLLAFACARALQGLSVEEAKRQRFQERSGEPAEASAALYWEQYQRGMKVRRTELRAARLAVRE